MTHTYNITGMTCNNCVAKVKSELLKLGDVTSAEVQQTSPQATITMQQHISLKTLQEAVSKAGKYTITETEQVIHEDIPVDKSWFSLYKPILLIGAYIIGITLLIEIIRGRFDEIIWMQNFMAAFFLTFSFFKLLDLKGFADSYASYDIIAKRWIAWGYIYPLVELALGIGFLTRFDPLLVNGATFVVMTISIIGVLQSIFNHKKIKCACLGAVFNLPVSTITVTEDLIMIVMSGIMIGSMI